MKENSQNKKFSNFFLDLSIIILILTTTAIFALVIYRWASSLYKTLF